MRYLSVCSGIEAATAAWHALGWQPVAFSEVDPFASAVLAHHYPSVPNWGDMTRFQEWPDAVVDLLVGGTPCQSFSVAGLRKGLADPRGNLMLTYLAIADRYRPEWLVWENVPGVLSSNGGRDFGTFLGGLGELRYGFAYRILDAQYFGVAQRRRRVFVVANARSWRRAAAVLFERRSLSGDSAPSREAGQKPAPTIAGCANGGGANGPGRDVDSCESLICVSSGQANAEVRTDGGAPALTCLHEAPIVDHSLRGEGFDASEDGTGRGTPLVPVVQPYTLAICGRGDTHALEYRQRGTANALLTPNGGRGGIGVGAIAHAFDARQADVLQYGDKSGPLDTDGHSVAVAFVKATSPHSELEAPRYERADVAACLNTWDERHTPPKHMAVQAMQVRRLTPVECERLQGFPDNYTAISWRGKPGDQCPDGPRYKALGNSMAVPVMRWIGERIAAVHWALKQEAA